MSESQNPSRADDHLIAAIRSNKSDSERVMAILNTWRKAHLRVRSERDAALQELAATKKALSESRAEATRLAKQGQALLKETQVLAATIDVAKRELAESGTMLMDAAVAISADFTADLPQVSQKPQPALARAVASPLVADSEPQTLARRVQQQAPAAPGPQASEKPRLPNPLNDLEESLAQFEDMLKESLGEAA